MGEYFYFHLSRVARLGSCLIVAVLVVFGVGASSATAQTDKCSNNREEIQILTDALAGMYDGYVTPDVWCEDGFVVAMEFEDNDVGTMPSEIMLFRRLAELRWYGSDGLVELPFYLSDLPNLERIELYDTPALLDSSITELTNIAELSITYGNYYRHSERPPIPAEIGRLTNLRSLEINYGRNDDDETRPALPAEIGSLSGLTELILGGVPTVPAEIGNLGSLERLELRSVDAVPPEVGRLGELTMLRIDASPAITDLPVEIGELSNLEKLIVDKREPGSEDGGIALPYVAVGNCASSSPSLIAVVEFESQYEPTISVDGVSYRIDRVTDESRTLLLAATLDGAGKGPEFSVVYAGRTQTVTCQDASGSTWDDGEAVLNSEVSIARSCLAGNGRVDFNIVNSQGDARYRIEFEGLSARERTVSGKRVWRMPFTGRPDGDYQVKVAKTLVGDDSTHEITRNFAIDCDADTPTQLSEEVDVITYCLGGRGFVRYQFVNPTSAKRTYIISFDGLGRNRSTTAQPFGASVAGVSGRPDGTYSTTVEYGDQRGTQVHAELVKIACQTNS